MESGELSVLRRYLSRQKARHADALATTDVRSYRSTVRRHAVSICADTFCVSKPAVVITGSMLTRATPII